MTRLVPYLGGALALGPVPFLSPRSLSLWLVGVGAAAAFAVVLGARRGRRSSHRFWHLIACAIALAAVAEAVALRGGGTEEFPGVADIPRVIVLVALGLALVDVLRLRTAARDWATTIDACVIAVSVGTVLWVFVAAPVIRDPAAGELVIAATAGITLGLVAIAALAARVLAGAGLPSGVQRVLAAAFALEASGVLITILGASAHHLADAAWLAAVPLAGHALLAAALLDPAMRELTDPVDRPHTWFTRGRLVLITIAVVAATAALADDALSGRRELVLLVVVPAALLLLVVARLAVLVVGYEQMQRQESILHAAATALAVAQTPREIQKAAVQAASDLGGGVKHAYVDLSVSARPGFDIESAAVVGSGQIATLVRGEIRRLGSLARVGTAKTVVVPLVVDGRFSGLLRVTRKDRMPAGLYTALGTLGGQLALALEGVARTDMRLEQTSEARFRSLVQNSRDMICVLEPDLTIRYATPSAQTILGFAPEQLIGTRFDLLLDEDDRDASRARLLDQALVASSARHDISLVTSDGRRRVVEAVIDDLCGDPTVGGLVLTGHDVTDQRELERQLTHQAFHDSLTGLPNRALLTDRVTHALQHAARNRAQIALLFLDVDDFKTINDSLGHVVGDEVLKQVAEALWSCLRTSDTAARLGGDEFALLLEDTHEVEKAAASIAERVLRALAKPVTIGDTEILVRVSIGIVTGGDGQTADELLRSADVAMYHAKHSGGGRLAVYAPEMHEAVMTRLELKADLERALGAGELDVHYQPIVELESGRVRSLEALVRWTHPLRGPISPATFVPFAEETGLIYQIGDWVLERACRDIVQLQEAFPSLADLAVNVNLSARQILQPPFCARVREILDASGLAPRMLTLEITESTLMEDVEGVSARLAELRSQGIGISIDDFGTGFSSLGYLQRFPVDQLKIAREFICDIVRDARTFQLVDAIIRLADSLSLRTVAEGIEEEEQRDRLAELGCACGQGYLFARPQPLDQLARVISLSRAEAA